MLHQRKQPELQKEGDRMDKKIENVTSQYRQDPVTQKIERVACYVRVSHQEQKLHGLSLDAQKMKLIEYAKEHNMKIVGWYMDEGVSGRKLIRKRPELQRMIKDAEAGAFDRIIFIKLDRFFRSVAEYHECMKRIAPVVWSTTEEQYDLTTANGRMLVNMKLTIAEMEADQTGERINIVNDYKVQTGQPLSGSQPFGFAIAKDEKTGHKKIIRDPDTEDILRDVLDYYMTHQSKRKTVVYLYTQYHVSMSIQSLTHLLSNTMLYGAYRENPAYCEAYMNKETFDKLQDIQHRNIKDNTAENRAYYFSGLIKCPECGKLLKGTYTITKGASGETYLYKKYRCPKNRLYVKCGFNKAVSENVFERMMLANIEKYLEDAKIRSYEISDSSKVKNPVYDIEELHAQIDRLNYSWQTGKIRTVEKYEADYAELIEQLEQAEAERGTVPVKDFSKIDAILQAGWRDIYAKLDDAHKRAFWRSFVRAINIYWTTEKKVIESVDFF